VLGAQHLVALAQGGAFGRITEQQAEVQQAGSSRRRIALRKSRVPATA
jgi:hypothetical protein